MLSLYDLKCEYQTSPLGLEEAHPRFSWKIISDRQNTFQTAYQICIDGLWDSGICQSQQSVFVNYHGPSLSPFMSYHWKVKIWDNHQQQSPWFEGEFETGRMGTPWTAKWIAAKQKPQACPVFERSIFLKTPLKKARIYATAYGMYDILINGQRVGETYFAPGQTSYQKRLQYQTYDATALFRQGANKISITLAKGWCKGRYPFQKNSDFFGCPENSLLAEFRLEDEAGAINVIGTDQNWTCTTGPLLFSEIYDGELYDARLENESQPMIEPKLLPLNYDNIITQQCEGVAVMETVEPIALFTTPNGETVLDFGQNMVGWAEFTVTGHAGQEVVLSHAEVLDKDGNFYTNNLRTAKQQVRYILKEGTQTWHPRFSFQGFRYVRIDKFPGEVSVHQFRGRVLYTKMNQTGWFRCSDPLINQLFSNILWSQKGNFLDIPTDCPQRDERVGWTGDAQVFCQTAAINMDVLGFFHKWLGDLTADQTKEGATLIFVPSMQEEKTSSAWGDAACICPWEIYTAYGDKKLLARQYPSMKKWIDYIRTQGENEYLWNTGFHFGDWLGMDAQQGSYEGATSKDLIATAFYAYSVQLTQWAAKELGYEDEAKELQRLHHNIVTQFQQEFITPSGRLSDQTQTAHVLALQFGLANQPERTANTLKQLLEKNNTRLTTGFVGTPYLCPALSQAGLSSLAYDLLLQKEFPSWLYAVTKGATTIWEHWDGIRPDGSFWSDDMNSFNHYAYGSIGAWMFRIMAGITPLLPGYRKARIAPILDDRISYVKAKIETVYGAVRSEWEVREREIQYTIAVPCNTSVEFVFQNGSKREFSSGTFQFSESI